MQRPASAPGDSPSIPRPRPLCRPTDLPAIVPPMLRLPAMLAACVLALACEPGEPSEPAAWSTPLKSQPGALLSVWGSSADDVWIVGADVGSGPAVLHYDGATWQQHDTGATGTLWWVAGQGDDVWMVGEGGLAIRHTRGDGKFTVLKTPTPERLYGVLPFAPDDVWAVGGDDVSVGVVWHWDGEQWSAPTDLPAALGDGLAYFKIWGSSPDDLWIVGEGGAALHRDAKSWERVDIPGGSKLFTVHGRGDTVLGVGGFFSALIVELSPGAASEVTPPGEVLQLNGVHVGPEFSVAVGNEGSVWRRDPTGAWTADADAPNVPLDYHATYIDPDGGVWAVGGRLSDLPPTQGLLAHHGQALASTTIEKP